MNDKPVFSSATTIDPAASIASTNKVLSNTYWLLALTLAFSSLTATFAVAINMPQSLALVPVSYTHLTLPTSHWG